MYKITNGLLKKKHVSTTTQIHTLRPVCVVIECRAFLISLSNLTVVWSKLMAPGADIERAFDAVIFLLNKQLKVSYRKCSVGYEGLLYSKTIVNLNRVVRIRIWKAILTIKILTILKRAYVATHKLVIYNLGEEQNFDLY